jgi:hypothetical protein
MTSKDYDGRVIAMTMLCLALLFQVVRAGTAFAQPMMPEQQGNSWSIANGSDAHASVIASRSSPASDNVGVTFAALPSALNEVSSERKSQDTTRFERALRAVSDPSQSEANDVGFLVLAVAIYLACLLVADHLRVAEHIDDGETRGHGDALIVLEETRTDPGRQSARCVESAAVYEQSNRIARS